jgi:hypothetical protein
LFFAIQTAVAAQAAATAEVYRVPTWAVCGIRTSLLLLLPLLFSVAECLVAEATAAVAAVAAVVMQARLTAAAAAVPGITLSCGGIL